MQQHPDSVHAPQQIADKALLSHGFWNCGDESRFWRIIIMSGV
jgi:hypothetical protein